MPSKKAVETLQQLCIQVIIKNIDKYRPKEIHSLPTTLLEELIEFPNDHEQKLYLPFRQKTQMITENITRLSLSFYGLDRVDIEYGLNTIPNQFKNLKQFICEAGGRLKEQEILNLVHSFPNIIDLELRCSRVNDDILEAIGDNCPNLRRLILPVCGVTDDGISRLCQSKSRGSNIKYLDVGYREMTAEGCLIALQNLKQLRIFNSFCMTDAFIKLFHDLNGSHELPTFELCELPTINMKDIPTGILNFITKCCPNVSNLSIKISNDLLNDVTEIKKCEKILPLKIHVWDKEFSMSHLTDVGSNVTSLDLFLVNVDLELIGYTCPNLKVLELDDVTYQPIVNLKRKDYVIPFSKLQKLHIRCGTINVPQLKFLLQNCVELEELTIGKFVITDADVFISLIHQVNALKHLTHLNIDSSS